jgi:hypothetical protein
MVLSAAGLRGRCGQRQALIAGRVDAPRDRGSHERYFPHDLISMKLDELGTRIQPDLVIGPRLATATGHRTPWSSPQTFPEHLIVEYEIPVRGTRQPQPLRAAHRRDPGSRHQTTTNRRWRAVRVALETFRGRPSGTRLRRAAVEALPAGRSTSRQARPEVQGRRPHRGGAATHLELARPCATDRPYTAASPPVRMGWGSRTSTSPPARPLVGPLDVAGTLIAAAAVYAIMASCRGRRSRRPPGVGHPDRTPTRTSSRPPSSCRSFIAWPMTGRSSKRR